MNQLKKICFVTSVELTVTAFLLEHLNALVKLYDVTVITNTRNANFLASQGIDVKVIHLEFSRKIRLMNDIYCLVILIIIFIKNRFSAVHSVTPKAGLLAMIAAFLVRVPFRVHTFTGQVWVSRKGFARFVLKTIDRLIGSLTTYNLVDSRSQCDFLINERILKKQKTIVLGNGSISGVNLQRFNANSGARISVRQELMIPDSAFVFIYLGRLNLDKGILDLAKAFSQLPDSKSYLLIVGPDEGSLISSIQAINKSKINRVIFVGETNKPERYLSASDVLCLPSYREGFGSVVIEAAAMSVSCIASNIYGLTDAVENKETGLLHEAKDIQGIKKCMEFYLFNPKASVEFGKAAFERVRLKFDSRVVTENWVNFYLQHVSQIKNN